MQNVLLIDHLGVIHIVRTHEGGGEGVAKKRMFAYKGEGGSLRSSTYACKKLFALFQVFERPQISDIAQKHDKNNTFHNEYFLL